MSDLALESLRQYRRQFNARMGEFTGTPGMIAIRTPPTPFGAGGTPSDAGRTETGRRRVLLSDAVPLDWMGV
jgi:hypothetical protein